MSLQSGTRIDHYEIQSALGAGGMGEVYRARDMRLGRDVALKVLSDSFAADAERIARFEREAQILAALSHANIAAIYGLDISGATRVLVMELVEGESLEARLRRGPLPFDDALAIARQVGDALSAAHERGVVHRDLKPGNIMLTPNGSVKVLDFGLARMVEPDPASSSLSMSPTISIQATRAGTILGTAPYMSPEQARGRAVDKRTDVWAFGCVLFEMLTGTRAFDGDDITDTIAAIVRGEPDWTALPASVPPGIVAIVRGCLAKEPRQRYADIAVPLHLLSERPQAPTGPAVITLSVPKSWWKRALPFAATVIVTAALVGAAGWRLRPIPRPGPVARFPIGLPEGQNFTNTGRRLLAVSPDGAAFVYVANSRLYLRSLADAVTQEIAGTNSGDSGVTSPALSPDGRQVAFFATGEEVLKRISVGGGVATTLCAATNPRGLRWEEDGLVFGQSGKGILHVSANGGVPDVLVANTADILSSPQLLPDHRGVLFSMKSDSDSWEQGRIVVQTPDGQQHTVMTNAADGRYLPTGHLLYAKAGVLVAAPFDLDRLATSGDPVPVVEGVRRVDLGANLTVARTNSGFAQYAVSDTGTLVYVPGPAKFGADEVDRLLAIFDGQDGMERLPLPASRYRYPRAARTGGLIAFEDDAEIDPNIYVYSLTGGAAARRLTFGGHNRAPIWSPDGQWIAFQSDREGDAAIFRQRADGSGVAERLTKAEPDTQHIPLAWSPDGQHLLFAVDKAVDNGAASSLSMLTLADKTIAPFGDVRSSQPIDGMFSPDGRWVLYSVFDASVSAADRGPRRQAFVQPFPATGAKYLVPIPGASHPMWRARDNQLIFNTNFDQSTAVIIRTAPNVTFTLPTPFSRRGRLETNPSSFRRNVDVLPDGRLIGVARNDGATASSVTDRAITVVVNWFTELNARVPPQGSR